MINSSQKESSPPQVLLVTGANGFVGRSIVKGARQRGWLVHATVRRGDDLRIFPSDVVTHEIDLSAGIDQWRAVLSGVGVVIHAAARAHVIQETAVDPAKAFAEANSYATERIAVAAAAAGVRRFVFVSSIGVNGNTSGTATFNEDSLEKPTSSYAMSKHDAEAALQKISISRGLEVVVVRPPLVYGPDVKANFLRLLDLINRGVPLPFKGIENRRSFIYVENLADLLLTCAINPAASGEIFLASDGSVFSTPQLMMGLAYRMKRQMRLFYVPKGLLKFGAAVVGRSSIYEQLCCSLEVDGSKAARQLGWKPIISVASGLDSTVAWYIKRAHK